MVAVEIKTCWPRTASAVAQRQADAAAATAHSAEALPQAEVVRHYVLLRLYQARPGPAARRKRRAGATPPHPAASFVSAPQA